jgi:glycerol-3-phosphate acyltransferase PlsY
MLDITLGFILSYLIGSIPTAYLVARAAHGIDLRREGSGNIGARNAYEVTGKKWIGIVVMLLDMIKGALPTLYLIFTIEKIFLLPFAIIGLVLGHCYPVWLRFKGGRGLATAAGILLLIAPVIVVGWLIFYGLARFIQKSVAVQSIIATFGVAVLEIVLYADRISLVYLPMRGQTIIVELHYAILAIAAIVISRFIGPVSEEFRKFRERQRT